MKFDNKQHVNPAPAADKNEKKETTGATLDPPKGKHLMDMVKDSGEEELEASKENSMNMNFVLPKGQNPPLYEDEDLNDKFGMSFIEDFRLGHVKPSEKGIKSSGGLFFHLSRFNYESLYNSIDDDPPHLQLYQITTFETNLQGKEVKGSRKTGTFNPPAARKVTNPGFRDGGPVIQAFPTGKGNLNFYVTLQVPPVPPKKPDAIS